MSNNSNDRKKNFRTTRTKATEIAAKKKVNHWKYKLKRALLRVVGYFLTISIGWVLVYKFMPIPITSTMISRKMQALSEGKDSKIYYRWVAYSDISNEAPLAVVAAEDQLFPNHHGFDFEAMSHAFSKNLEGEKLRGASTLSQQVAKNVFLWQSRSYIRKIMEVYFTVLIELIWGKERILEVYLNVAEMGRMTFGIGEASKRYFGTSAKNLTRQQAARMAAVLPSPVKWSVAKSGPYVNHRTATIVRQMRVLGGVVYIKNI